MSTDTALQVIAEALSGQADDLDDYLEAMQVLIDDGTAWKIEGVFGRNAMTLIEMGHLTLGPVGFHDAFGNYVPSRYEVKPGTKGSIEWAESQGGWLNGEFSNQGERMMDAYEGDDHGSSSGSSPVPDDQTPEDQIREEL